MFYSLKWKNEFQALTHTPSHTHGGDWDEWHEDLRVREMPEAFRDASSIRN